MPRREDDLYLLDIKSSIQKIENFIKGLTFRDFQKNIMATDAVIRNLEVIGEAARHISLDLQKKYKEIPWKMIVEMRNKMTHEYFGIDLVILWNTITKDIPLLKKQIKIILAAKNKNNL